MPDRLMKRIDDGLPGGDNFIACSWFGLAGLGLVIILFVRGQEKQKANREHK